jgi:hypothetical protein
MPLVVVSREFHSGCFAFRSSAVKAGRTPRRRDESSGGQSIWLACWQWPPGSAVPRLAQHSDTCPYGQGSLCLAPEPEIPYGGKYSSQEVGPRQTQGTSHSGGTYGRRSHWGTDAVPPSYHEHCQRYSKPAAKVFHVCLLGRAAILGHGEGKSYIFGDFFFWEGRDRWEITAG